MMTGVSPLRFSAIRMEIHPEQQPEIMFQPEIKRGLWMARGVVSLADKKPVGFARQQEGSPVDVNFVQEKGGFQAVVTTPNSVYIALPGSSIRLPDTEVRLPGERIGGMVDQPVMTQAPARPQRVTPQVSILGAGKATRFERVSGETTGLAKPAVPLVGRESIITQLVRDLREKHGFRQFLVNTWYKRDGLKNQLDPILGENIHYIDEDEPSGTAGGLVKALRQSYDNPDNPVIDVTRPILIMQGDAVTNANLSFLLNTHAHREALVTLGTQRVPDEKVSKVGIVVTDNGHRKNQSGYVTAFMEKPSLAEAGKSRMGSLGFYVLSPEVFPFFLRLGEEKLRKGQQFDYAQDFFPALLKAYADKRPIRAEGRIEEKPPIWAQSFQGRQTMYWGDAGSPRDYVAIARDIYEGRVGFRLPEDVASYYDPQTGAIYWEGGKQAAEDDGAWLAGNVIALRKPDSQPIERPQPGKAITDTEIMAQIARSCRQPRLDIQG